MEWLEAALAFAVIMIALSTIVSVLTETFHRILRLREDGLTRMVRALYQQVVQPRLAVQLKPVKTNVDDFVAQVTSIRYRPWSEKQARWNWLTALLNRLARFVPGFVNAEKLKSLSTLEFVGRFAETPAGQALAKEAEQRGENFKQDFLKDLVSKYEDYGENTSDYFERRARLTSIVLSILLAISLNINVIELFQTLVTDKGVRDAWISKGEEVTAQWERQEEQLTAFLAQSDTNNNQQTLEKAEALINANLEELKNSTESLKKSGLPIGWEEWPWRSDEVKDADTRLEKASLILQWIFLWLFSGIMIGLGGPFWFNIYRKLGSLTGITREFQSPIHQQGEPGVTSSTGEAAARTTQIVTDVFDTASKGHAMALEAGRSLLATDGRLDKGAMQ
ncbi:MAG: hypothetical protein P8Z31_07760 [Gammaproteobacteria bacterium]